MTNELSEDALTQFAELLASKTDTSSLRAALAYSGLLCTKPDALPALYMALTLCDFPKIEKNTTVNIRPSDASKRAYSFKYADMEEILLKTKPVLRANGLGLLQPTITDAAGQAWLVSALVHKDGAIITSQIKAPEPTKDPKDFGGLLTFMRRYMVNGMLCLSSDDDLDNDDRGGDHGSDERGHDERPAPRKTPQRRSALTSAAPNSDRRDEPASAAGDQAEGITEGQYKNLLLKVGALEITEAQMAAMLKRLGIPAFSASMSLADWTTLKAELANAAKAMQ